MESCKWSWSTSNFAEIGLPARALAWRPLCSDTFAAFSALASSACSLSSYFCAQPTGIATNHATRNASAVVVFRIVLPPGARCDGTVTSFASAPQSSPWWPNSAPRMSKGTPFLGASAASANANFACASKNHLMSHADAIRSMWGRGRVTHVLPGAGRVEARWRPEPATGRASAAVSRRAAGRRFEVVDRLDAIQLPLQALELGAHLSEGRAVGRLRPIELGQDLPRSPNHVLVLLSPRRVKERRHLLVPHGLDSLHAEQRGLAPHGLHFLREPLEQLFGLRGLREDPGGSAQAHGAHPLEPPPDADAAPGANHSQAQPGRSSAHPVAILRISILTGRQRSP